MIPPSSHHFKPTSYSSSHASGPLHEESQSLLNPNTTTASTSDHPSPSLSSVSSADIDLDPSEATHLPNFSLSSSPSSSSQQHILNKPLPSAPSHSLPLANSTSTSSSNSSTQNATPAPLQRQSSLSRPLPPGAPKTPRTANRVRFDLSPTTIALTTFDDGHAAPGKENGDIHTHTNAGLQMLGSIRSNGSLRANGSLRSPGRSPQIRSWVDDEDPLDEYEGDTGLGGRRRSEGRERLLEGMEAPTVSLAMGLEGSGKEGEGSEDDEEEGDMEEWERERRRPKSGVGSAFMNMANSIIGAGIIGQPYAFKQAGLLAGIILLVGLTITVDWTIRLIVINSKLSGANSFQSTMEHCFGKPGLIAISLAQWVFAFGGMVAFCVIVGDTIPHVLTAIFPSLPKTSVLWVFSDRRFIIVIFILGISYPLSLYRDIAKLAKASTLALISMLVIIVTVITQGARIDPELRGPVVGSLGIKSGTFQAIGVISFAFVCHHNSLLIYGSLQKPTMDRFAKVTHYSTGISMLACLTMALAGFLTFGNKTLGNVLNNFPDDNIMVNIARLCFGLNMLSTLPLESFVCREVLLGYFYPSSPHSTPRHLIITTAHVLTATLLSLLTCDLGAVFELIGATSACALAYILPPLCFIKLSTRSRKTWLAWAVVAFGVSVMVISTVGAVGKMFGRPIIGDGGGEGGGGSCK